MVAESGALMKKSLFVFCILLLAGCYQYSAIWTFDEIPDLGISTTQDAMTWVSNEIKYVSDSIHYPANEYWQSPLQTFVWRCGDCEDYVILVLYLIHRDVGIDGKMAVGSYNGNGHAWVIIDGTQWEPQTAEIVNYDPLYSLVYTISYDEVIERATTTHKSLTAALR